MSHIKHCKGYCVDFENKLRDKSWREKHPRCIGICKKYSRLVLDSLCGCEEKKDGSVTLWNFAKDDSEYSIPKYHWVEGENGHMRYVPE